MRKITALVFILLAILAITYRATHHPIYGKCHQSPDGYTCTLIKWAGNK